MEIEKLQSEKKSERGMYQDVENNYIGGENNDEENRIESSEERSDEVQAHGWSLLPKRTYDAIKQNKAESWREIDYQSLQQESPKGNTVLHVAALYGNDRCVERIVEIGGAELLTAKNRNGDTPLHVAARAGHIYTLHKLLTAVLRNPNSEQAKEAILVTNNQGNTLFHEAFLNGHKDVMEILDSSPGFRELVEKTVFTFTNKEGKSVLHLAFEKGYEDIVDDVLTRTIPGMEGT
ncbi:ankyrin repeat-containing protein P16F5.05c-like isoform X1 [Phaseolus vulgaris]|uniref:ankyrin repeat-containing protein P16F5.05c-like isoform X1 n=1 Tax=Phaseolus vulgaris TaxID=3885 RepID=UPI0035CC64BA